MVSLLAFDPLGCSPPFIGQKNGFTLLLREAHYLKWFPINTSFLPNNLFCQSCQKIALLYHPMFYILSHHYHRRSFFPSHKHNELKVMVHNREIILGVALFLLCIARSLPIVIKTNSFSTRSGNTSMLEQNIWKF